MDPMTMLESDNDWTLAYDFDKLTLRKKREFIEMVFARQQNLSEIMYCGQHQHLHLSKYEKVYREQRNNIIFGLNGKLNFYEFSTYFTSFFQ